MKYLPCWLEEAKGRNIWYSPVSTLLQMFLVLVMSFLYLEYTEGDQPAPSTGLKQFFMALSSSL